MAFNVSIAHLVPTHIHLHILFRPSTEPRREQVLPNYLLERTKHSPRSLGILYPKSTLPRYPEIESSLKNLDKVYHSINGLVLWISLQQAGRPTAAHRISL